MNKTLLATLVGLAVLTGCEKSSNTNYVTVPAEEAKPFNAPYTISFEGLTEGAIIGQAIEFELSAPQGVLDTLLITGATKIEGAAAQNAATAVDKVKYTTEEGGFVISRGDNASVDAIALELVVFLEGYFTSGQPITIPASADIGAGGSAGASVVKLTPLAPETEEVAVTSKEVKAATDDNGAFTEALVIQTPPPEEGAPNEAAVAGGTAKLDIPAGVVMKDKEGNPVTGEITANVAYFSNEPNGNESGQTALDSFPGGLAPTGILDESGQPDEELADVSFISAGFTAIQLSNENGDVVSEFSDPIDLTFQVSADTINPDTGEPVTTGETIPVWSYDETVGVWKAEGEATVGALNTETNTFTVTKEIDHLSYYNLDYYRANCAATFTINDIVSENYDPLVRFTRAGGGWTKTKSLGTDNFGSHEFDRMPSQGKGTIGVYQFGSKDSIIKTAFNKDGEPITVNENGTITYNFCDLEGSTINVEGAVIEQMDYSVSLQSQCSDTQAVTQQSGMVRLYARDSGSYFYKTALLPSAGFPATTQVAAGSYSAYATINVSKGESWKWVDFTIEKDQDLSQVITFDAGTCGTPGGGTGGTGGTGGGGAGGGSGN